MEVADELALVKISGLAVLCCVSCGRTDPLQLVKLAESMWPNARACLTCLARYGRAALAAAADAVLAGAQPNRMVATKCLHCGEPTVLGPDGLPSAWCGACEAERRRLVNGG